MRKVLLVLLLSFLASPVFGQAFVWSEAAWDPVNLEIKDNLPMGNRMPIMFYQVDVRTREIGQWSVWVIDKTDDPMTGPGVITFDGDGCGLWPPGCECSGEGGQCENHYTLCNGVPYHTPGTCVASCAIPFDCMSNPCLQLCVCEPNTFVCPPPPPPPNPDPIAGGGGGCPNGCSDIMACPWDGDDPVTSGGSGCSIDCSECPEGLCDGAGIGCGPE